MEVRPGLISALPLFRLQGKKQQGPSRDPVGIPHLESTLFAIVGNIGVDQQ
jgi:hypothetical protein